MVKAKKALPKIAATPASLTKAEKELEDEAELKRQRSCMSFWLQSNDCKVAYDALKNTKDNPRAKKAFLVQYLANKIDNGQYKTKQVVSRDLVQVSEKERGFEWMSKKQMIDKWGEEKAEKKILKGNLEWQADPDTKEDGEWDREYKIWHTTGSVKEQDKNSNLLTSAGDCETEESKKQAQAFMTDLASCIGQESEVGSMGSMGSNEAVPMARDAKADPVEAPESDVEIKLEGQKEHAKTFEALLKNPKTVALNLQDCLLRLKCCHKDTADGKYTQELHEDLRKQIPKVSAATKKVEMLVTESIQDKVQVLALAIDIDKLYTTCNSLEEWHDKLVGGSSKKRRRTTKG